MTKKKDILNVTEEEFENYWEDTLQKSTRKLEEREAKSSFAGKKKRRKIELNQYPGDREFDKILHEIGLSVDPLIMKSLFRDKIELGQVCGYKEVLGEVLPEHNIFLDENEFKTFLEYYLSLWNSLAAEYKEGRRKTSEKSRVLRKKCLDMLLSNVKFIRELDKQHIEPDKLPQDLIKMLLEGDSMVQGVLALMENKPEEADKPEAEDVLKRLGEIEFATDKIKSDINKELGIQLKH